MFWQYNEDKCHVQQVNDVNIIKYSPVKKKKGFLRTGRDTRRRVTGETHRERAAPGEMHRERATPGETHRERARLEVLKGLRKIISKC
jgi:hypothetical protein